MSRRKSGIVNVRMVITEEKILSNIDKVQKMINPNSKKAMILWEEDDAFKKLISDIREYALNCDTEEFPVELLDKMNALQLDATNQVTLSATKIDELKQQIQTNKELSRTLSDIYISAMAANPIDEYEEELDELGVTFIKSDVFENINEQVNYFKKLVSDFKRDAEAAIKEILNKGKVPIVVGGTGLYVNSLIYGIEYQDMKIDEEYRNELMNRAEDPVELEKMWDEANTIDPEAMQKISKNDKKRIVRVLEIYKSTGKTKTEHEILSRQKGVEYDYKVFGITMERGKLYSRINLRVDIMIKNGLEEEVRNLLNKYEQFPTAMQGLGYKEVKEYFDGILTREEMIEKIKQESRRYAKRQLTWFRRNEEIIWLDKDDGLEENLKVIFKEL